MANWQSGASFANSFLSTIQGLTALQNAQMQNARLANTIQRETEYENELASIGKGMQGQDLNKIVEGLKLQDIKSEDGTVSTADQQRQAWQQAIPEIQKLPVEQQQQFLQGLGQSELAQGLGLDRLKAYQTAGGETRFNELGREAMRSDVYSKLHQRMTETGNVYGQEQALKMGKFTREDEAAQDEYDMAKWLSLSYTDPVKWVTENQDLYNKARKGSILDDGLTGKVVTSADGKTSSFARYDKKGKLVDSTPITAESIDQIRQPMAFAKYQTIPGKFKEAFTMGIEREKLDETKRSNRAVEGIQRERNAMLGGGGGSAAKTAKQMQADAEVLFDAGAVSPYTNKPFTSAKEAYNTLVQVKSGLMPKVNDFAVKPLAEGLVMYGRQVYQQDPKSGEWVPAKGLPGSMPDKYAAVLGGKDIDTTRPGAAAPAPAAPQQAIPVAKPDLSKWTMKPAGKTLFGETDYVLEGPSGRMSLGDFIDRYGYNPTAEFIGRR